MLQIDFAGGGGGGGWYLVSLAALFTAISSCEKVLQKAKLRPQSYKKNHAYLS